MAYPMRSASAGRIFLKQPAFLREKDIPVDYGVLSVQGDDLTGVLSKDIKQGEDLSAEELLALDQFLRSLGKKE